LIRKYCSIIGVWERVWAIAIPNYTHRRDD
jgi:hypothetical protein